MPKVTDVQQLDPGALPFSKKVLNSPTGQDKWDSAFLERKSQVKDQTFTLKDGREIGYAIDGDISSGIPVMAFHGGCMTKAYWLQKTSIEGVCLIMVDRAGYGGSSASPPKYTWKESVEDVVELADHLKIGKFIAVGHSMGAMLSTQLAAALPDRVVAVGLFGCGTDPLHEKCGKEVKKLIVFPMFHPRTGCCGCLMRGSLKGMGKQMKLMDFSTFLKAEQKSGPDRYAEFVADPFWVSATLWSLHQGMTNEVAMERMLGTKEKDCDFDLFWNKWHFDIASIKCPVFLVHGEGDHDVPLKVAQHNEQLIPGAKLEVIPGSSHTLVTGATPDFRVHLKKVIEASGLSSQ
uniref:AB hydrolase-1 domain-containing protein n=1 Tax=Chromera velia CCMP2878 TaxID=1169474 RepID=A0A0G4GMN9_9ALVE|eukprot:Cvel_22584.t1-p1 / transcript=Cvel_22584.t1 / gene=Cvel_22584 / organism=Chromera_velia_CCMP2878 / gene_product=Putative non-heme haloperoxidase, putative / transcript_product=Putative non-heme haloperoxidase, putative / location=Cvel_scaffold2233:12792-14776(-) / protein_length=347 / sequence_SO=supercontig / SO=protein_coding / is_pseudo=false